MNSATKVVSIAAVLLLLTLPLKFLWLPAAATVHQPEPDPAQRLHAWLEATRTPIERRFEAKPRIWHGWQVRLTHCSTILLPQPDFDGTELLRRATGSDDDVRYVFRGRISERPPFLDTMIAKIWFVAALSSAAQSDQLVVIVAAPKGCRDYEALDWPRLWDRDG